VQDLSASKIVAIPQVRVAPLLQMLRRLTSTCRLIDVQTPAFAAPVFTTVVLTVQIANIIRDPPERVSGLTLLPAVDHHLGHADLC
jgi:hypothetical protein